MMTDLLLKLHNALLLFYDLPCGNGSNQLLFMDQCDHKTIAIWEFHYLHLCINWLNTGPSKKVIWLEYHVGVARVGRVACRLHPGGELLDIRRLQLPGHLAAMMQQPPPGKHRWLVDARLVSPLTLRQPLVERLAPTQQPLRSPPAPTAIKPLGA